MSKVFVVYRDVNYEGSDVVSVFSNVKAAEACKAHCESILEDYVTDTSYRISEVPVLDEFDQLFD